MAGHPTLTKGNTIQVPNFIQKGFAMDYDGDAVTYHVPGSDDAVRGYLNKLPRMVDLPVVAGAKAGTAGA